MNDEREFMGKNYNIAVFPGDGIGKEIVPQALRVLNRVASMFNINIKTEEALIGEIGRASCRERV